MFLEYIALHPTSKTHYHLAPSLFKKNSFSAADEEPYSPNN